MRRQTDKQAAKSFDDARAAAAKITDADLRAVLLNQVDAAEKQYQAASAAAAAALRSVQRGVASLGQAVSSLSAAQRLQAQQAYELADAAVEALTLRAPVAGVVQLGGAATGGDAVADRPALLRQPAGRRRGRRRAAAAPCPASTRPCRRAPTSRPAPRSSPSSTSAELGLTAEVDETDVLLVKPGVTATVELDAATGASYDATVRAVDLLPTTSARGGVSYQVRLDLAGGKYDDGTTAPTPRPGMSAVVRLQVRQATDAVTVPASAVVNADGQDTVWAVRDDRYQRVPVKVGVQGEDVVQVTAGLDPGQRIVVAGADQVHAGDKAS